MALATTGASPMMLEGGAGPPPRAGAAREGAPCDLPCDGWRRSGAPSPTRSVLGKAPSLPASCCSVKRVPAPREMTPDRSEVSGNSQRASRRGRRPRKEIEQQHGARDCRKQQRDHEDGQHRARSRPLPYLDRLGARPVDRLSACHVALSRPRCSHSPGEVLKGPTLTAKGRSVSSRSTHWCSFSGPLEKRAPRPRKGHRRGATWWA